MHNHNSALYINNVHIKQKGKWILDTLDIILRLISQNYPSDAAFEIVADLKPKTVYDWKRGKSSSYLKMLPKLSELFGISTDYLLGNEQKKKPSSFEDSLSIDEKHLVENLRKMTNEQKEMFMKMAGLKFDQKDWLSM